MRDRDIIIVAFQPWDYEIGSNAKNIALEFSKRNRVLYVNSPLDRISKLNERKTNRVKKYLQVIRKKENGLTKVQHNIWNLYPDFLAESINWISIPFVYDFINRHNTRRFSKRISDACHKLNFSNIIIFNDNLIFKGVYLKEFLNPDIYIYYIRDYLISQTYFKRHGLRIEPEVIKISDLVVSNSVYLRDYCKEFNENSFYIGQGCEIEAFDSDLSYDLPYDMNGIESPTIGYVGFLTTMRLDIKLIRLIAVSRPNWNVILVGPEDENFSNSDLHDIPNVYFLGPKKPEELPSYIASFDVCINPQEINDLTIGNYPRKIDEYMAMGKPSVATKTVAMGIFESCCYLASTPQEFIEFLQLAIDESDSDLKIRRVALARSHTWENSVNEIYQLVKNL
jgi:teichuronic acid biosynthesis glycosyltransferase TuaH